MKTLTLLAALIAVAGPLAAANKYQDGRPEAGLRIDAKDTGPVFRHGGGPGQCDILGARDIWVYEADGTFYMHYDGSGPKGWLACLATSKDLANWQAKGPVLDFGAKGEMDSASASYGVTYFDRRWPTPGASHRHRRSQSAATIRSAACPPQGAAVSEPPLPMRVNAERKSAAY